MTILILTVLLAIVLFIIWLRIDFVLGMKKQRREAQKKTQETRYSSVDLLTSGDEFFHHLLPDIQQATDHIHILFYIIKDDNIGQRFLSILQDKAKEGIRVRLLVDRFGCDLKRKTIKTIKKSGISFAYSHRPQLPFLFFSLNRRNHRKIAVVDGKIGYIGGFNVADEYLGRDPTFGFWRDFHLRLAGDGVQDLQGQFLQDWEVATNEKISLERYYPPLLKGSIPIRIFPTDGVFLETIFLELVRQAKHSIVIGSPYFIPGQALQEELITAARKGIDVRLIVPKKADHPLVKEASYPYLVQLIKEGIDIYQYYRGFYHTKTIIIDNQLCDIGTANFDKRSLYINHEINCLIYDTDFVEKVKEVVEYDIAISEQLTLKELEARSFVQRGKEQIATLLSGLL